MARLLAADLPRSAHVGGDEVSLMVASGAVGPVGEPRAEAERHLLLRAHDMCSLANDVAAFDCYPVLDHVVPNRDVLDLVVGLLTPRPVLFVTLADSRRCRRSERRPRGARAGRRHVRHTPAGDGRRADLGGVVVGHLRPDT